MKKLNYIFVFVITILLNSSSIAFVNNKNSCQPALIYCPQQITCSQDGNIKSCTPIGNNLEYWNTDEMSEGGRVSKGTYKFSRTNSTYQTFHQHTSSCTYLLQNGNINKIIYLSSNKLALIEAAADNNSTGWLVDGYNATCLNPTDGACPFVEPGLFFDKMTKIPSPANRYIKVKLSVNGNIVKKEDATSSDTKSFLVTYDDAFSACGGVKQCKIDIDIDTSNNSNYPTYTGSVVVDMMNNMQIISINTIPCSGYTLKRVKSFNTIVFEKFNELACSKQ